jgi:hypothetical protein
MDKRKKSTGSQLMKYFHSLLNGWVGMWVCAVVVIKTHPSAGICRNVPTKLKNWENKKGAKTEDPR